MDVAKAPTSFFILSLLPCSTCPELALGVALKAPTAKAGSETWRQIQVSKVNSGFCDNPDVHLKKLGKGMVKYVGLCQFFYVVL